MCDDMTINERTERKGGGGGELTLSGSRYCIS